MIHWSFQSGALLLDKMMVTYEMIYVIFLNMRKMMYPYLFLAMSSTDKGDMTLLIF